MKPLPIVEHFDVCSHQSFHHMPRFQGFPIDPLNFQAVEKTLGACIVLAFALAAHTADEAVPGKQLLVCMAAILAAPVAMEHEATTRLPYGDGHHQRVEHQRLGHPLADAPSHHFPAVQVYHDSEVQPPLGGGQIGDVAFFPISGEYRLFR